MKEGGTTKANNSRGLLNANWQDLCHSYLGICPGLGLEVGTV